MQISQRGFKITFLTNTQGERSHPHPKEDRERKGFSFHLSANVHLETNVQSVKSSLLLSTRTSFLLLQSESCTVKLKRVPTKSW